MLKILTFTTLYPNAAQRQHGIFVETRLRKLVQSGEVAARVVAPVPWFPRWVCRVFSRYRHFAEIPEREERHSVDIRHPRYLHLPKLSFLLSPFLLAIAAERAIRQAQRSGFDFDLIDAHYFYPDGVAATIVGWRLGKPVVITARGSDLTQIGQFRLQRRLIRWAALKADAVVTVCQALKDELMRIVGPHSSLMRIAVLRNGVDLELFRPIDRLRARKSLGANRPTLLSVGLLIPRKAHDLVIRAMAELSGWELFIVGQGPELPRLQELARALGVADRVRFCGAVGQESLRDYYNAADLMVLASSREGWANVLLESMACGTRVVASDVWGTPEVVTGPDAGQLVPYGEPHAIAAAVRALSSRSTPRAHTRSYAEQFSWDATTEGQIAMFREILEARDRGVSAARSLCR